MTNIYEDFLMVKNEKTDIEAEIDHLAALDYDLVDTRKRIELFVKSPDQSEDVSLIDSYRTVLTHLKDSLSANSKEYSQLCRNLMNDMFRVCSWVVNHVDLDAPLNNINPTFIVQINKPDVLLHYFNAGEGISDRSIESIRKGVYSVQMIKEYLGSMVTACKQWNLTTFNRSGELSSNLIIADSLSNLATTLHINTDELITYKMQLGSASHVSAALPEEVSKAFVATSNTDHVMNLTTIKVILKAITDNVYIYSETLSQGENGLQTF